MQDTNANSVTEFMMKLIEKNEIGPVDGVEV